jgi:TatD DNase family protein
MKMNLIDIHAHLETKKFDKDFDNVLDRASKAGVKVIINSGVNPGTNRKILALSKKYDLIKPSFGLYPIDALAKEIKSGEGDFLRDLEEFDVDKELKWIEEHKADCVAIGEVGLDYNWPDFNDFKEKQKDTFEKVVKLAIKIDKTLVVHSRKAELDAIEILERNNAKKVVMHCFSAKKSLIKRVIGNGWFLSVPPIIKRLQHFQTLVEMTPIEQLLTETDSPYLSPVAGERNEPANVEVTIEEIARIKGLRKEEVADKIWQNSKKLFDL